MLLSVALGPWAAALVLLGACSSSTASSGAGTCRLSATSIGTPTAVTKSASSDPTCPTLMPSQVTYRPCDGCCAPHVNLSTCTASVSCTTSDGTFSGTETASGGTFSASYTLTLNGDAGTLSCSYDVSGTVP